MKRSGGRSKYTDNQQIQTVIEYLTNDESAREIGDRLDRSEQAIRVWIRKWRPIANQAIADGGEGAFAVIGTEPEVESEESPF